MKQRPARITLLTQADCTYCDHAKGVLARVNEDIPLEITEIGLDTAEGQRLATQHAVLFAPGLLLDGRAVGYGRLSERRLRKPLARRPTTPAR